MKLFVYYKLIATELPDLQIRIQAMQAELKSLFPGLSCDLLKRPESDDAGRETWMESYHLPDIDIMRFRNELDRLALKAELPQPRKNELFVAV